MKMMMILLIANLNHLKKKKIYQRKVIHNHHREKKKVSRNKIKLKLKMIQQLNIVNRIYRILMKFQKVEIFKLIFKFSNYFNMLKEKNLLCKYCGSNYDNVSHVPRLIP